MDQNIHGFLDSSNVIHFGSQSEFEQRMIGNGPGFEIAYADQFNGNGINQMYNSQEHSVKRAVLPENQHFPNCGVAGSFVDITNDDCEFSDEVLRYINRMLMEEDMDDKTHMLQESLDLKAKEKSFYEAIGKEYPPSPQPRSHFVSHNNGRPYDYAYQTLHKSSNSVKDGSGYLIDIIDPSWMNGRVDSGDTSLAQTYATYSDEDSYIGLSNFLEGFSESPVSPLQIRDLYSESQSMWNFQKGVEEASKFLPSQNTLSINVDIDGLLAQRQSDRGTFEDGLLAQRQSDRGTFELEKRDEGERSPRGKKNRRLVETDLEEESRSKLPSIISDSSVPVEEFDALLLHSVGELAEKFAAFRSDLQSEATKHVQQNGQRKTFSVGKGRGGKKPNKKKEVIDLRHLLIQCATAVAGDDRKAAGEMLTLIRQHSSPFGDGNQRLAYYFANGLEARLAGNGSKMHKAIVSKRTTASDYLKAYYTYLASSPFRKLTNFATNKTIMNRVRKAAKVHIIDFGILYGFQWPTFIQRVSYRKGGPPRLRITGIDFPQPGFKPAERVEDTGRRLARYAETFNVPFEYNAIAQNWETIKLEDLKIEEDELVCITCLFRTKNLLDETVVAESSRTQVLNLIRSINPTVFIHGIVNGTYSAPFFVTRFKEALFHFSALFDMMENNVPREKPERLLIERDIFGREALNVVACEGWERVERPESYKQWQVRNMRAGFMQLPFDREVMNASIDKVRSFYHKDFMINEDSKWLLLGWKGRTIYGISCWKPAA